MLHIAESTRGKLILKGFLTCRMIIQHACLRFSNPENLSTPYSCFNLPGALGTWNCCVPLSHYFQSTFPSFSSYTLPALNREVFSLNSFPFICVFALWRVFPLSTTYGPALCRTGNRLEKTQWHGLTNLAHFLPYGINHTFVN
ncbi:hypothetical protein TNCV_2772251 [Trichonephila clavipes]|nr:hypothetical protein TNCV_2772251 [Trichonephila clavipes]